METERHAAQESDLPPELSQPAQRALAGAGIAHLEQLTKFSAAAVLQLHGVGPKAIGQLRRALAAHGLAFAGERPGMDAPRTFADG